jgi:hypothetical protein
MLDKLKLFVFMREGAIFYLLREVGKFRSILRT